MGRMITVRKSNKELTVPEEQKERYLSLGFSVFDEHGKLVEAAPAPEPARSEKPSGTTGPFPTVPPSGPAAAPKPAAPQGPPAESRRTAYPRHGQLSKQRPPEPAALPTPIGAALFRRRVCRDSGQFQPSASSLSLSHFSYSASSSAWTVSFSCTNSFSFS